MPPRYYLSAKACAGILRRAEKRGKELPPLLKHALMQAAHKGHRDDPSTDNNYVAVSPVAFGGNNTAGPIDVATAQTAHGGTGRMDFESETFIAHALRAEGFDASEDGTGRGTPLVPICFDETQITSAENRCNPRPGDPSHPLAKGARPPTIAFSAKDYGADAMTDLSPTLRAGGHSEIHANAGVMPAVAFNIYPASGQGSSLEASQTDTAAGVTANQFSKTGDRGTRVVSEWRVRRLTPLECARLQGFPDEYLNITYRGKPAADGPRYRALGNSFAVNVVRWIGLRIRMVEDVCSRAKPAV